VSLFSPVYGRLISGDFGSRDKAVAAKEGEVVRIPWLPKAK
jgi:hypothetical protein